VPTDSSTHLPCPATPGRVFSFIKKIQPIELGKRIQAKWFLGADLAQSKVVWGLFAEAFSFMSAMQTIWRLFDGQVRSLIPLFDREIQGMDSLRLLIEKLFA
jgi:hypothetical protein